MAAEYCTVQVRLSGTHKHIFEGKETLQEGSLSEVSSKETNKFLPKEKKIMHGLLRSLLQEHHHQQQHDISINDDTIATNAPTNSTSTIAIDDEGGGSGSDGGAIAVNLTHSYIEAELAEEEHVFDANASLALNATLIVCLLLAYYVKKFKIYYLTESAGALIVGMIIGGMARLTTDNLQLFEFVSNLYTLLVCFIIFLISKYFLCRSIVRVICR